MKLLEPAVLFDPSPRKFPADGLCSADGRWEQLLACVGCRSTRVRFLGPPDHMPNGALPCGHVTFETRVFFGCDDCGVTFTITCNQSPVGIWMGCQWGRPLVQGEPAAPEGPWSDMIEILVPGDIVAQLSPNTRLHYYTRHRRQQEWQHRAWLAWHQAGRPRVRRCCRLTLVIQRGRRTDVDNAIASCKALLDGLKDQPGRGALLPDDSSAWVSELKVEFHTGARYRGQEQVTVRAEAIE